MSTWRYIRDGQERGPIEEAELQRLLDSGTLNPQTLVSREGSSDWVPVESLSDFKIPAGAASSSSVGVPPVQGPSGSTSPPPPAPPISDAADIEQNKVYDVLAYIGLLFLVPLLAVPNSKFARYHTNQGIVLFIAILITMAGSMVLAMIPIIGCVAALLPVLIGGAAIVFMILGIVNAASGQYKPLPLIGHYQLLK